MSAILHKPMRVPLFDLRLDEADISAVATKVSEGTITSSPGPTPAAR